MSSHLASPLSPVPVSTTIVLPALRTRRQFSPSVMRLRSSAGILFCQSIFGTTPNIAPPSRRKRPAAARRVQKSVAVAARAVLAFPRQDAHAGGRECLQVAVELLDLQRDVVNALAALRDELGDDGILRRGFEQLQARLAERQQGHAHLLAGKGLEAGDAQAEGVAVELQRLVERAHGDADVLELHPFTPAALSSSSTTP